MPEMTISASTFNRRKCLVSWLSRKAECHSEPLVDPRVKNLFGAQRGETESGGEYEVKVKQGKRWNQKISLVCIAEFQGSDSLPFQEQESGHHHANKQNDCQCP